MVSSERDEARPEGVPFGRYRIRRRLGRGGMGEVFLADQLGPLGPVRAVALKRLLPQLAGDAAVVRLFLEEMGAAAGLNHPNVATVYDFGEIDGEYYLAMELIDGLGLDELLRGLGALPIPAALAIITGVLEALAHAHGYRGREGGPPLVHSDVSTHNVMVSRGGAVKLLDFGLARAEAALLGGPVRGKVGYVAPEQLDGAAADRRFDLYAAGVIFYELLAGVRPFAAGTTDEVHAAQRAARYTRLAAVRREAAAFSAIIDRALAPDPARRIDSAEQLLEELRAAARDLDRAGPSELVELVARVGASRPALPRVQVTETGVAVELVPRAPSDLAATEDTPVVDPHEARTHVAPQPRDPREPREPLEPRGVQGAGPEAAPTELARAHRAPPRSTAPAPGTTRSAPSLALLAWGSAAMALLGAGVVYVATRADGAMPSVVVVEPRRPVPAPGPDPLESAGPRAKARDDAPAADAGVAPVPASAPVDTPPDAGAAEPRAEPRVTRGRSTRRDAGLRSSPIADAAVEPATAKEEGGVGVLSVRSVPWSRVTLDGRSFGEGIVAGKPVPAGRHRLTLEPGNHEHPPRSVELEIRPGVVTKVFVDFASGETRIDPP